MKTPSVPGLERGLTVLELLAHCRTGLTLPEVARSLELPKSSAHTLLVTLERQGYLRRNERTSRYLCSAKLFSLGNLVLSGLPVRSAAAPRMLALTERTGLTTHLAVLERNEAVLVEKVEARGVFKLATWLGKRMELHCTSLGKALLSHMGQEELSEVLGKTGLPRHNDNSIHSMRRLKDELARARRLGYAIDDEEDEIGHRCVGAPIFDGSGHVAAALSISGTIVQIGEDNSISLAQEVVRTARAISRALTEHNSNPGRDMEKAS